MMSAFTLTLPRYLLAAVLFWAAAAWAQAHGHHVRAVGLSAILHSVLPIDASGNALDDALIWADTRGDDEARTIRATHDPLALATADVLGAAALAAIVLRDSAHLLEEEARHANEAGWSRHRPEKPDHAPNCLSEFPGRQPNSSGSTRSKPRSVFGSCKGSLARGAFD